MTALMNIDKNGSLLPIFFRPYHFLDLGLLKNAKYKAVTERRKPLETPRHKERNQLEQCLTENYNSEISFHDFPKQFLPNQVAFTHESHKQLIFAKFFKIFKFHIS